MYVRPDISGELKWCLPEEGFKYTHWYLDEENPRARILQDVNNKFYVHIFLSPHADGEFLTPPGTDHFKTLEEAKAYVASFLSGEIHAS